MESSNKVDNKTTRFYHRRFMKILHVAVFNSQSTNVWQSRAFEEIGHSVIKYDYRKPLNRLDPIQRDLQIIYLYKDIQPDVVLFSKCNGVNVNVIKECNSSSKTEL